MKFKGLSFIVLIFLCHLGYGQMTLHPSSTEPLTPDNLIQNVFIGNGIEIISSSYTGLSGSVGLFDNAINEVGIEKGIVLSTGFAANVIKENSAEDPISSNTSGTNYVDRDLEELAQVEVVDLAKFEITFVPSSDVLRFRYVFASEEYPDFVCADKNDVFGFFITGDKPGGGRYEAHNMAVIPDPSDPTMNTFLDLPVTINSVNGGGPGIFSNGGCEGSLESLDYSNYYNEVPVGSAPAFNAYLDVFIAQAEVIPCETYTIKIVIGDGNDQNEDSAVFLEERSFSTGTLSIDINNPGVDGGLSEGCAPGSLRIMLPEPTLTDFPLEIKALSGPGLIDAAIPGVDFMDLPTNNFIPAGSSYLDLDLMPVDDNLDEGTEYLFISIRKSICTVDTLILPLYNNNLESVSLSDTVYTCDGEIFELEADLGDNINPASILTFENDAPVDIITDERHAESTIKVFGLKDIALNPKLIAEICIDSLVHPRLNDLDIYLRAPSGQVLELSTDNGYRVDNDNQQDAYVSTCFHIDASTTISLGESSEGSMDLSNPTYTGDYLPEGDFESWLSPITSTLNGDYSLFVIDDKQQYEGKLYSWHISFSAKYEVDYHWTPSDNLTCGDCEIAEGVGGSSQYYYMELIDSYGCTVSDSVWVEVSDQSETPTASCENLNNGGIRITWSESANSQFYEYEINNSGEWLNTKGLGSFNYSVFMVDVIDETTVEIYGLLDEETVTVAVRGNNEADCFSMSSNSSCTSAKCSGTLPQLDSLVIQQPICESEKRVPVKVYATSDNGPLTYRVFVGTASASNEDGDFSSIPVGTWPLRIIDTNGCAIEVEIKINEAPRLELLPTYTDVTCSNDTDATISIEVDGIAPPFTYEWNTGATSSSLSDLPADFYSVTVTDNNSCTSTMDFDLINPGPLSATYIQSDNLNCNASNDVSATLNIVGGVEPYEVTWNGVTIADTIDQLAPGTITYLVTDANGCTVREDLVVSEDEKLSYTFSDIEALSCAEMDNPDGSALVSVIYGTAPFTYEWSSGEGTALAVRLDGGENSVTITDMNGCTTVATIDIPTPEPFVVVPAIKQPSCYMENDGAITLTASGGVGQISFSWEDGTQGNEISSLPAGIYSVELQDDNCTKSYDFEIPETVELSITEQITKVKCDDAFSGIINITPTGGSGDYNYTWTGPNGFSSNEQNITGLEIGIYRLVLSDRNNPACTSSPIEIDLLVASELGAIIQTLQEIKCNGDATAILNAIPSGGQGPYTYEWSDSNTSTNEIENLTAGTYQVTITDSNDCSSSAAKIVEEPELLQVAYNKEDVTCYGESDASLSAIAEGGIGPYTYEWSNGSQDANTAQLAAGQYELTVTDQNFCTAIISEIISEPLQAIELSAEVKEVSCAGGSNGSLIMSAEFGKRPYMYRLETTQFTSDSSFTMLSAGTYIVEVMDANLCMSSIEIELPEAYPIEVNFMNEMNVSYGADLQLDVEISNTQGNKVFEWDAPNLEDFSCVSCPNPIITNVTSSFSGLLMIIDSEGCEIEKFYNINVLEDESIDVPTGFSPNGDNVNDVLIVHGNPSLTISKFEVYTRWGEMVYKAVDFHPGDISKGWNGMYKGSLLAQDSYIWTLECEMQSGRLEVLKGQTTLIK